MTLSGNEAGGFRYHHVGAADIFHLDMEIFLGRLALRSL
jgi:hypothetical protein